MLDLCFEQLLGTQYHNQIKGTELELKQVHKHLQ